MIQQILSQRCYHWVHEILKHQKTLLASDVDLDFVASKCSKTNNYSGADLAAICQAAAKHAIAEAIEARVKAIQEGREEEFMDNLPKMQIEKRHMELHHF